MKWKRAQLTLLHCCSKLSSSVMPFRTFKSGAADFQSSAQSLPFAAMRLKSRCTASVHAQAWNIERRSLKASNSHFLCMTALQVLTKLCAVWKSAKPGSRLGLTGSALKLHWRPPPGWKLAGKPCQSGIPVLFHPPQPSSPARLLCRLMLELDEASSGRTPLSVYWITDLRCRLLKLKLLSLLVSH